MDETFHRTGSETLQNRLRGEVINNIMGSKTRNPLKPGRRSETREGSTIGELLAIMARLRAPGGCPWDREQDHMSLRYHAVEEVYEMIDAIEASDDPELCEELGDLLLQVVFHSQMAREREAFDFDDVAQTLVNKLVHRHPHVFGDAEAKDAAAVWDQWDRLKTVEKEGTNHERSSALDGVPRHLPGLLYAQKLSKKATRAGLSDSPPQALIDTTGSPIQGRTARRQVAQSLFALARFCQEKGWSAEDLLRQETKRRESIWREAETRTPKTH